jgi:hypothetical protein
MKTAIFVTDDDMQIVFTAENEWERTVLEAVKKRAPELALAGSFYDTRAGYYRHSSFESDRSVMLRFPAVPKVEAN